jgi:hemerythrin superfamily protein
MAKARRKSSNGSSATSGSARKRATRSKRATSPNAIELLKEDHRKVETWFAEFEKARSDDRKQDLAERICMALKVHTTIEEEIFYPAFREETGEEEMYQEAEVEHESAEELISRIESSPAGDDRYDAQVKVLSHMIEHHVYEEEKRDGIFAKARQHKMDLEALGEQLAARKNELEAHETANKKGLVASLIGN